MTRRSATLPAGTSRGVPDSPPGTGSCRAAPSHPSPEARAARLTRAELADIEPMLLAILRELAGAADPRACWEWPRGRFDNGYGAIKHHGRQLKAHRVVFALVFGETPAGKLIRHRCDNPPCVRPSHLVAGTDGENQADKVARGRSAKGERNGASKLTAVQVAAIRASVEGSTALGHAFGVSRRMIWLIRSGRKWT